MAMNCSDNIWLAIYSWQCFTTCWLQGTVKGRIHVGLPHKFSCTTTTWMKSAASFYIVSKSLPWYFDQDQDHCINEIITVDGNGHSNIWRHDQSPTNVRGSCIQLCRIILYVQFHALHKLFNWIMCYQ